MTKLDLHFLIVIDSQVLLQCRWHSALHWQFCCSNQVKVYLFPYNKITWNCWRSDPSKNIITFTKRMTIFIHTKTKYVLVSVNDVHVRAKRHFSCHHTGTNSVIKALDDIPEKCLCFVIYHQCSMVFWPLQYVSFLNSPSDHHLSSF